MTIFGFYVSAAVFWLGLAVIFLIIEAIWFAAGSFVALLLSLFDVSVIIQFVVFLIVSFCLLLFTRRIFVEKLKTGSQATNTDALIGQTAETISEIRPLVTGQVRINGQVWSAVGADDDAVIPCGAHVKIIAIEGVKLLVKPEED